MISCKLYLKHPMSPGNGEFLIVMNFAFCPRVGEVIQYGVQEYSVEKVVHSELGIALIVSMSN